MKMHGERTRGEKGRGRRRTSYKSKETRRTLILSYPSRFSLSARDIQLFASRNENANISKTENGKRRATETERRKRRTIGGAGRFAFTAAKGNGAIRNEFRGGVANSQLENGDGNADRRTFNFRNGWVGENEIVSAVQLATARHRILGIVVGDRFVHRSLAHIDGRPPPGTTVSRRICSELRTRYRITAVVFGTGVEKNRRGETNRGDGRETARFHIQRGLLGRSPLVRRRNRPRPISSVLQY